ncbi:metallophosphoesterase [Cystobacter fuscus]
MLSGVGRALPFVAVGTSTVGLVEGSSGFVIREVEVRLRGLPRALDGFRIGQITDVHVGTFIDTTYVRAAVAAMNAARVDLQVMTGDLIDDLSQLDETMAALETCEAPHGMLAILGNHEHWRGVEEVLEGYARSARRGGPVRLLVDEAQVIEHAGQKVRVVGVDYPMRGRSMSVQADRMQRSAEVAFAGASADEVIICLTHHPSFFPLALEKGRGSRSRDTPTGAGGHLGPAGVLVRLRLHARPLPQGGRPALRVGRHGPLAALPARGSRRGDTPHAARGGLRASGEPVRHREGARAPATRSLIPARLEMKARFPHGF